MRVYHYPLQYNDSSSCTIQVPRNSTPLTIRKRGEHLAAYFLVDPNEPETESYTYVIFGTGWDIPDDSLIYITTIEDPIGYVWHIFQHLNEETS